MHLYDVVTVLEEIAPPTLAEEFDVGRVGLNLDLDNEIGHIAVALDPTEYVLQRASVLGSDLLITHHTLLFHCIHKISRELATVLGIAIENEISLYSMHTNYDKTKGGVNDVLAQCLGLKDVEELEVGRIGYVDHCPCDVFVNHVAKCLGTPVMYAGNKETVESVMVFGGSGFKSEYLQIARDRGVDAYVSSEFKHDLIRSFSDMLLVDATHYATENPAMKALCPVLQDKLKIDVEFIDDNPRIKSI